MLKQALKTKKKLNQKIPKIPKRIRVSLRDFGDCFFFFVCIFSIALVLVLGSVSSFAALWVSRSWRTTCIHNNQIIFCVLSRFRKPFSIALPVPTICTKF